MGTSLIFIFILFAAVLLFTRNVRKISRNIKLGKDIEIKDNKKRQSECLNRVIVDAFFFD